MSSDIRNIPGFDALFRIDTVGKRSRPSDKEGDIVPDEPAPKRRPIIVVTKRELLKREPLEEGELPSIDGELVVKQEPLFQQEPLEEGELPSINGALVDDIALSTSVSQEIENAFDFHPIKSIHRNDPARIVEPAQQRGLLGIHQIERLMEQIIDGIRHLSDFEGAAIVFTAITKVNDGMQVGIATAKRIQFLLDLRCVTKAITLTMTDFSTRETIYTTNRYLNQLNNGSLTINKIAAHIWFEFKKRLLSLANPYRVAKDKIANASYRSDLRR